MTQHKQHPRTSYNFRIATSNIVRLNRIGFLSSMLIAVMSAARGWPFATLTSGPWFYQFNATNDVLRYAMLAGFLAGVGGLCWCWLRLLAIAKSDELSVRQLAFTAVAWSFPLCIAVPLFSGDVFVYYVDGQALARGYSPYETGVSAMGTAPMVHMVHELWRTTTTMYGPVFMWITEVIANISGDSVVRGVLIFRLIAVVSVVATALGVVSLARSLGRPVAHAFVFAILNPLTLLHLVNGAHNDATMIALLVAGLAVGVKARSWPLRGLAIALVASGAMFKITVFAGVLILGWMWCRAGTSIWSRILASGAAMAFGLVVFQALTMLTGLGWGWTASTDVPGLAHPLLAPANALALSFGGIFGEGFAFGLNSITRGIASLIAVGLSTYLVLRAGRAPSQEQLVRILGYALLLIAWLGPAVYPWYLTAGIVLIGVTGGRFSRPIALSAVVTSFLVSPGGFGYLDLWADWRRTVMAFLVTAVFGWMIHRVYRRSNEVSTPEDEVNTSSWISSSSLPSVSSQVSLPER